MKIVNTDETLNENYSHTPIDISTITVRQLQ